MGFRPPVLKNVKLKIIILLLIISSILLSAFISVNAGLFGEKIKKISGNELKEIKFELNLSKDPIFYSYTDSILKEAFDKEINSQETPGLTFGSFILNALYEEKLVNRCYPAFVEDSSDFFIKLAGNLSDWQENFASKTTKLAIQGVIEAYLKTPKLSIGTSTLFFAIDLAQIGVGIAKLAEVVHNRALHYYLVNRSNGDSHEIAWSVSGIPPLYDKWQTENFFQSLWNKYGEAILSDNLDNFKKEQHEILRVLILQSLNQPPNLPTNMIQFKSDGKTILKIGKTTTEKTVILKAKISDPDGNKVKLQIELRRLDEHEGKFDEDKGGLQQSDLFENNSEVLIPIYGLTDGHYHWRARVIDEYGISSEWVSFGGNPDSAVDFTVGQEIVAPVITSPLKITPAPPYYVGDTINAEFSITNKGATSFNFSVLTVGGRDPDNHVSDFTHRQNITLEPFKPYNYQGALALNKVGDYHFFCTYQTPDGNWNTSIDLGSGLADEDRIEDINVKEKGETQLLISEELKVSAPPEVIWSRELYEPWPRYIMQTPDGGYIFASGGGCDRGFIGLTKLDSFGQKTGESRLRYRCPWVLSLQKTPDGGYILLAFADEIGGTEFTMYLIKTDASGHKIWDKRFNEKDQSGRESDIIRYLEVGRGVEPYFFAEQTPDGGYILAGVIYYKDSEKYHPWLIKTDSKGDKQWEKIFEEEGVISSLQQTSDGGYILVVRGCLIKTDAFGQKVFKKIFEEKKAHRLQQTPDGGYILAGVIDKDSKHYPWLMKTNSNVDEQWEKIFEDEMWPYFVQQTPDGGYILVGNTKDNIELIKTDASGQKIWNWTEKAELPELESFQQTSDGGYIVLMDSQLIKLGSLEETQKEQVTEFFEEFKEEAKKEISPYHVEYEPIVTANIFTDLLVNISGPADELGIILTNPEGWSTTRSISKRDLIDNFESVKVSLCKEENPPSGTYNLTIKTITPEKTVYQKEIRFSPPVLEIIDAKVRIIEIEGSPLGGVYVGRGHYLTDVDIVVKNWGDLPLILRRIVITLRGRKTQEMNLDQFKGVPYGETKIKEGGKRGSYLWNFDEDIFHSAVIKLYSFSEKDCLAEYQAELRVDRYDSLWDVDVDY